MKPSDKSPKLRTFDLFDTLITRTVLVPEDVFLKAAAHLQQAGLWSGEQTQFRKLRISADARTRRRYRTGEITLDQIYDTLADSIGWDPGQAARAQAIEVQEELACVRPVPEMKERWKAIEPTHKAIISDTYFSVEVIQQLLDRCGIECGTERLFLSSMYLQRKSTGKLFRLVASKFGVDPGQIHHVGDNAHSDVVSARKEGFTAELYRGSAPLRYESAMRTPDDVASSRIAGALRTTRLAFPGGTGTERTLWEIGSVVAAPILFSYVSWVIAKAKKQGLPQLYFLARDGQILLKLAHKIDPDFPSSYLLASRQAWHLPSIVDDIDERSFSWILDGHAFSSLRSVLRRIGIEPEEITGTLLEHGFRTPDWEVPVQDRKQLKALFTLSKLRVLVFERAFEARERVGAYLRSRGVLENERLALVDLGWNGRLQRSLSRLLQQTAPGDERCIEGFYFSLKRADREKQSGEFHTCFGPDFATHRTQTMLMELFCSADHGGLLGFAWNQDGTVTPVLVHEEDKPVIDWGLRIFQSAVLSTADSLIDAGKELSLSTAEIAERLRGPAARSLDMLAEQPSRCEAEAFGTFPFTYDQSHGEILEMAPAFSAGEALAMFLPASIRAKSRTMWMQATLVRSLGRSTSLALRLFRFRDTFVGFLQRKT